MGDVALVEVDRALFEEVCHGRSRLEVSYAQAASSEIDYFLLPEIQDEGPSATPASYLPAHHYDPP